MSCEIIKRIKEEIERDRELKFLREFNQLWCRPLRDSLVEF